MSVAGLSSRRALLTAALGFALLESTEPEVLLVQRWHGSWASVGLVAAEMARQDYGLELMPIGVGVRPRWPTADWPDRPGSRPPPAPRDPPVSEAR